MDLNYYELYVAPSRAVGELAYPATIAPPYHKEFSEQDWPNGWRNIDQMCIRDREVVWCYMGIILEMMYPELK